MSENSNCKIDKLPSSLILLNILCQCNIHNLSPYLNILLLGNDHYNKSIDNIPNSIEFLSIKTKHIINKLPSSLIHLELYSNMKLNGKVLINSNITYIHINK